MGSDPRTGMETGPRRCLYCRFWSLAGEAIAMLEERERQLERQSPWLVIGGGTCHAPTPAFRNVHNKMVCEQWEGRRGAPL